MMLSENIGCDSKIGKEFAEIVKKHSEKSWDMYIEPLIEKHWKDLRHDEFYDKFKELSITLYAASGYSMLIFSRRRNKIFSSFMKVAYKLKTSINGIIYLIKKLFSPTLKIAHNKNNRKIILVSAFISLIDELFDNRMNEISVEKRVEKLTRILSFKLYKRNEKKMDNPAILLNQIVYELRQSCDEKNKIEFEHVIKMFIDCAKAETNRIKGKKDPENLCHRMKPIRASVKILCFATGIKITKREQNFMINVAILVQMIDDWVDRKKDKRNCKNTPVLNGIWTKKIIMKQNKKCTNLLFEILKESHKESNMTNIFIESFNYQIRNLAKRMEKGNVA